MAFPGRVLAAVDVGQVLERVGRGADEREIVLAGVDDAVGGGVGVELGVAEVDHHLVQQASPPLALTMLAQALTAFTDFWNRPGASDVSTSAIMPTLMVVAVSPMSVPGAADPAGEEAPSSPTPPPPRRTPCCRTLTRTMSCRPSLQPAASRTAASAAIIASRRARAGNGRLARRAAPPRRSLLAVTVVSSHQVKLYVPVITKFRPGVAPPDPHLNHAVRPRHGSKPKSLLDANLYTLARSSYLQGKELH